MKRFQQLQLIQHMAKSFLFTPTLSAAHHEPNGLALSSRNQRLSPHNKKLAEEFVRIFHSNQSLTTIKTQLNELSIDIDYLEEINHRRFIAVTPGDVRLIDNCID